MSAFRLAQRLPSATTPSASLATYTSVTRHQSTAAASTPTPTAEPFRRKFDYDKRIFWYPSHQSRAVDQLKKGIHHIDVVIEVRDARIPITSINSQFDEILAGRERIVVYNKADLANHGTRASLIDALRLHRGETPIFTCANKAKNVKDILDAAIEICRNNPARYPYLSMIVVGIPNVGKSSLINALRHLGVKKGKATAVGKVAGVTTAIQTRIKIYDEPPIYLFDTPGIFDPHVNSPETGLKISLTGATRDRMTEETAVADYLLFRLNNSGHIKRYPSILGLDGPTDQIYDVLRHICRQHEFLLDTRGRLFNLSATQSQLRAVQDAKHASASSGNRRDCLDAKTVGELILDTDKAARYFIEQFRQGVFGPLTLDDCSRDGLRRKLMGIDSDDETDAQTHIAS